MTAAEKIKEMGIVPVVVLEDEKDAGALAKALCEGGLPCAEVTFRTAAAKESIRIMLEKYPEMFVGAGTVLTTRQVDEAIEAGARFIVSPGFDPDTPGSYLGLLPRFLSFRIHKRRSFHL